MTVNWEKLNLQFRDHGTDLLYDDNSRHLDRFVELGIDYVRFVIRPYENSDGTYDEETTIREYQNQINALCARGIDPVVIVNEQLVPDFGIAENWRTGTPDFATLEPLFIARVDTLAQRFGETVRFWEIWNEPNIDPYFQSVPGNDFVLDDFIELTNDSRERILNRNSSAQTIFGGLSNTWRGVSGEEQVKRGFAYWEALSARQTPPQYDYLDIHPYSFGRDGSSEATRSDNPAVYFYLNQNVTVPPTPSDDCVIPASGVWPECATGAGETTPTPGEPCPASGAWPRGCIPSGAVSPSPVTGTPCPATGVWPPGCVPQESGVGQPCPDEGSWPTGCIPGGQTNELPVCTESDFVPGQCDPDCIIPDSGPWPGCATLSTLRSGTRVEKNIFERFDWRTTKPLWIGEIGWETSVPGNGGQVNENGLIVGEAQQSEFICNAFDALRRSIPNRTTISGIVGMTVYSYEDIQIGVTIEDDPNPLALDMSNSDDWRVNRHRFTQLVPDNEQTTIDNTFDVLAGREEIWNDWFGIVDYQKGNGVEEKKRAYHRLVQIGALGSNEACQDQSPPNVNLAAIPTSMPTNWFISWPSERPENLEDIVDISALPESWLTEWPTEMPTFTSTSPLDVALSYADVENTYRLFLILIPLVVLFSSTIALRWCDKKVD